MADTPQPCPTCATEVPAGAERCPGCGRVFGEENRCPHCHAIAAVIERRGKTVCAACGKPRVGAVTLKGKTPAGPRSTASHTGRRAGTEAMLAKARGRAQRGLGITMLAGAIALAAAIAIIVPGGTGLALAAVLGAIGVTLGGLSIRAGAKNMERARGMGVEADQTAVRELAEKRGGVLSAAEVADALKLSVEDADALLTSMIGDGTEVDLEVDDEGAVTYAFHALRRRAPQVRVEPIEEGEEVEVARDEAGKQASSRADG